MTATRSVYIVAAPDAALCRGAGDTPFGPAEIAWSAQGIHRLEFLPATHAPLIAAEDAPGAQRLLDAVFGAMPAAFTLALAGTPFQLDVWRALAEIPAGETVTYGQLAARLGRPSAARAVGAAVGANPVAVLVPCHRVVRADGNLGGYRWGTARKQQLLAGERQGATA